MIYVLYGYDRPDNKAIFDGLFKLRHKVFIEGRRWALPSVNGLEIDQYDTDDAVYFVEYGEDGEVTAHVRLTPTLTSSLIADYFPHLVENGANPRDPRIVEATRFMILPTQKDKSASRVVRSRFMSTVIQWCMDRQITHTQTVIDAGTLSSYVEISMLTDPLGLSHPFGGGKTAPGGGDCMAFRWPVGEELLDDILHFGNLPKMSGQPWQILPSRVA